MRRIGTVLALITLVTISGLRADGRTESFRSAFIDERGQLHLAYAAGADIVATKRAHQLSFEQPRVSGDHHTVGWLETYQDPGSTAFATPIADSLIVYRAGRIVRIISTPQVFWSWRFANRDEDIVSCTGPTHGGATDCTTRSIATGLVKARWSP